jgi:Flp pilus assembly protein TadG
MIDNRIEIVGRLKSFLRDERGGPTVEFTIWVPAFFAILMIFADMSLFFLTKTSMADACRTAARKVAVRELPATGVADFLEREIQLGGRNFTVETQATDDEVVVTLNGSIAETTLFGFLSLVSGDTMSVRATYQREPTAPVIGGVPQTS